MRQETTIELCGGIFLYGDQDFSVEAGEEVLCRILELHQDQLLYHASTTSDRQFTSCEPDTAHIQEP